MMKNVFLLIASLICHVSMAQVRTFNKKAQEVIQTKDTIEEIEEKAPSEEYYEFLSEGNEGLNDLFLSELKDMAKAQPDELAKSQTLTSLATLATEAWKGTHYTDRKRWRALSKHFRRAFNRSTTKFNYTREMSFLIKLVNNHGKKFYCDKKAGVSELNLYAGKKTYRTHQGGKGRTSRSNTTRLFH